MFYIDQQDFFVNVIVYMNSNESPSSTATIPPRTFVIGDIHGCLTSLELMEEFIGFNAVDTIILLGDYIDRGPDSKGVMDWCIDAKTRFNLVTIIGNHELMMHEAKGEVEDYLSWIMNGGQDTLRSFGCKLKEIPQIYWDFIYDCELYHETSDYIFVHGGLEHDKALVDQTPDAACWIRFRDLRPHQSKKTVICGHTPTKDKEPEIKDFGICLDTHVFNSQGYLTCLQIDTGEYWQTSERGKGRVGKIDMRPYVKNKTVSLML